MGQIVHRSISVSDLVRAKAESTCPYCSVGIVTKLWSTTLASVWWPEDCKTYERYINCPESNLMWVELEFEQFE